MRDSVQVCMCEAETGEQLSFNPFPPSPLFLSSTQRLAQEC